VKIRTLLLAVTCAVLPFSSARADEKQPPGGFTIIHPRDRSPMVWVPGGSFLMGINADTAQKQAEQIGYSDYHQFAAEESFPEHRVFVEGFYMDKLGSDHRTLEEVHRRASWLAPGGRHSRHFNPDVGRNGAQD